MKTKFTLLACALLFTASVFAQTEVALVKPVAATEVTSSLVAMAAPALLQPSFCNYQITSINGTCHNVTVGDVLCKPCPGAGNCPASTSCTKGDCTVNVTLISATCTSCLYHGHHAKAWTCD